MAEDDGDVKEAGAEVSGEEVKHEVAREQLRRLGHLTDGVYAVALVVVVHWLPLPAESTTVAEGPVWLLGLFVEHLANLGAALIGVVFIILYWLRSTDLGARLDRTDNVHVSLSILSVVSLLFLLYMVRVGAGVTPISGRVGESVAVALIGIFAGAAFWRARAKGLLVPGLGASDAEDTQIEALTEPMTALVTIPFAFVGELWWNLAWFAWVPLARLLGRRLVRARRRR